MERGNVSEVGDNANTPPRRATSPWGGSETTPLRLDTPSCARLLAAGHAPLSPIRRARAAAHDLKCTMTRFAHPYCLNWPQGDGKMQTPVFEYQTHYDEDKLEVQI